MTKIDQFASVFKAAVKERFVYQPPEIAKVSVITDLEADAAQSFLARTREFLKALSDDVEWSVAAQSDVPTVAAMLQRIETESPDLICAYRNLSSRAWQWKHSLGDRLDILIQETAPPVLVLPHPDEHGDFAAGKKGTATVGVLTDHLTGDGRLASWGARFTAAGGRLFLTHVEDEATFERYIEIISKIPELDTETSREQILAQLLKEPRDYMKSAERALAAAGVELEIVAVTKLGHRLDEHLKLIADERLDLLIFNTLKDDQFAMHGLAYPLALELRDIPILML